MSNKPQTIEEVTKFKIKLSGREVIKMTTRYCNYMLRYTLVLKRKEKERIEELNQEKANPLPLFSKSIFKELIKL